VHRRDALRGSKITQERAFKNPKIEFIWDTAVDDILDVDKGKVTTVRLKNVKTDALHERPVDGLFVAIGHEPNTQIFRGQIELLPNGYVKVKTGTTQTSVAGVFAAGDVQDFTYRQAVTAAGTGCMAALEAERYLEATQPHWCAIMQTTLDQGERSHARIGDRLQQRRVRALPQSDGVSIAKGHPVHGAQRGEGPQGARGA